MFYFGHFFAALMGLMIPSFFFFMGEALDSFSPANTREQQMAMISRVTLIFICIAVVLWLVAYLYWALLVTFSVRVSSRIKEAYLGAILK